MLTTSFLVLYGFSIAYLIAPGTFDSAHIVEFIGGLPEGVKYAGKAVLAAPFAFHSLNGLRHLGWDMAKCQSIIISSWYQITNLFFVLSCHRERGVRYRVYRSCSYCCLNGRINLDKIISCRCT